MKGNFSTILKVQRALEQAGIYFTEGSNEEIGVGLKKGNGDGPGPLKTQQHGKRK